MSYEPKLIIRKKDLENSISILEKEQYSSNENTTRVAEYLLKVNQNNVMKFDDLELVLCIPELTTFNRLIRNKLNDLEIDFQIDY